jgi:rsbT co-antagonist protein RsbR
MSTQAIKQLGPASLAAIVDRTEDLIIFEWITEMAGGVRRKDLLAESELQLDCMKLLRLIKAALNSEGADFRTDAWNEVRVMLDSLSRDRAIKGFTPSETASFVFSAKRPIFTQIRQVNKDDPADLAANMWAATELLDAIGLYTIELSQQSRENVLRRQQEELLELSTPVVKLWDGILVLPIVGTLDSARTQVMMESLLDAIVKSNASIAIVDITGVPAIDTVVAQHLLKTITAARLMGADCIISGVRPQIAQTIVHLGITLADVTTKSTLAAAIALATRRLGITFKQG